MSKGCWLINEKGEDLEVMQAALRASAAREDGDRIIHWRIVDPPLREAAWTRSSETLLSPHR